MRYRRSPEKLVVARIDNLCAMAGCVSIHFSQARASNQTPGIPDRLYFHPEEGVAFWVEAKARRGRQSDAQKVFQSLTTACHTPYVLGGYREVLAFLLERHLWHLPVGVTLDMVAPE